MLTNTEIRSVVFEEIENLLLEEADEPVTVSGHETVSELALNSLSLARLIIGLEAAVGADPFTNGDNEIADMRTVDDLVRAYQAAALEGSDHDRARV